MALLTLILTLMTTSPDVCTGISPDGQLKAVCLQNRVRIEKNSLQKQTEVFRSSVVKTIFSGEMLFIATKRHGVYIYLRGLAGAYRLKWTVPHDGLIHTISWDGKYLFIVDIKFKSSVYRETKAGFDLWRDGRFTTESVRKMEDPRFKVRGKIISVHRGTAKVNVGRSHGLSEGDSLEIISIRKKRVWDPIKSSWKTVEVSRRQSINDIKTLMDFSCYIELKLNQDIRVGDQVRYTTLSPTGAAKARKWPGLHQFYLELGPGLMLGDPSVLLRGHYRYDFPGLFTLKTGGYTLNFNDAKIINGYIHGGISLDYFEVGIGGGFLRFSGGSEDSVLNQYDKKIHYKNYVDYSGTDSSFSKPYFSSYARIGAIDGLKFELGIRTTGRDFAGIWAYLQIVANIHTLFLDFDFLVVEEIKDINYVHNINMDHISMLIRIGDRIRLFGNGGSNTLFLNLMFGWQMIDYYGVNGVSTTFSAGMEYRL